MPPEDISCMEAIIKKAGKMTNDTNKTGSDKANKDSVVSSKCNRKQKIKENYNPSTASTSTKAEQKTENKENVKKKKTDQEKKKPAKKANKTVNKNEKSRAKRKNFF